VDFNLNQKHSLLSKMGYTGPAEGPMMEAFIRSNPGVASKMGKFSRVLQKKGFALGGLTTTVDGKTIEQTGLTSPTSTSTNTGSTAMTYEQWLAANKRTKSTTSKALYDQYVKNFKPTTTTTTPDTSVQDAQKTLAETPGAKLSEALIQDPSNLATQADVAPIGVTPETLIDSATGQVGEVTEAPLATAADASQAEAPVVTPASLIEAATVTPQVKQVTDATQAATGTVAPEALVTAAQKTDSSLEGMQAAQGTGILMNNPVQRSIADGELVSGSAVDAAKIQSMMEDIQAAQATPSKQATVQGQLEGLLQQFDGGQTPAWAAGAMRQAQAVLAQRGLGASSIAGQAVIQAAMESALPIAQADANTIASFEAQNLSNRQQTALFAAQQRASFLQMEFDQNFQSRVLNAAKVSDIANMNFTAEQTIALENSRIVNSVNLENLNNRQAMVLAQASALANLDISNLNNRQQAAVQNAQSFLQMDLTNLSNEQQTELFRAQSLVQSLFTDQAATNAAAQFNAASENQVNQFFAELSTTVSRFNAEQTNAINQFNAGETNALEKFNAQIEAARQQFNANNSLVIAQANAQWRQNVATVDTAAQNEANMEMARTENALTAKALDEIWQKERDWLAYAFSSTESEKDRAAELLLADKKIDADTAMAKSAEDSAEKAAMASLAAKVIFGSW
jgi:hypothetical protein